MRAICTFLVCLFSLCVVLAAEESLPLSLFNPDEDGTHPELHSRTTNHLSVEDSELAQALDLVQKASSEQGAYNDHRIANPRRNTGVSQHSAKAQSLQKIASNNGPKAPVLTAALRKAAAVVAEHQAKQQQANGTSQMTYRTPKHLQYNAESSGAHASGSSSSYWLASIKHTGHAPMGANNSYPVWRDVTNHMFAGGAKGDGVHDDTEAINAAIAYGGNCGEGCLSSSVKGTLIYFPKGTYLISSPINAMYYSQLVGDPTFMPTIKTSKYFIGLGAIQSDVYVPGAKGDEWYVEQSNFYRQVRNFKIDITQTVTKKAAAFHWQVAQATSMTNVWIYASTHPGTTQIGLFTENGSGGFMSEVYIDGGKYGIYGGNQQYTVRNFEISRQTDSCICLIWDWGWTWKGLFLSDAPNGFNLINPESDGGKATPTGSIYVMDSSFARLKTAIKTGLTKKNIMDTTIITLDNIGVMSGVGKLIRSRMGKGSILLKVTSTTSWWAISSVDVDPPSESLLDEFSTSYHRPPYFAKSRPQYVDFTLDNIISVKDHGAKGDGKTDDTAAIKKVLGLASSTKLIYFPAGTYIITSTITVPANALITGEVWSQLAARGSYFEDMMHPKPMVKVGNPGDRGTVEISDMLFTSIGPLAGLTLVEWNVAAAKQGSVGMFDSHFRIGGAYGTKLSLADCPKKAAIPAACVAATMLLHVTPKANGYFENVWGWVADHDMDDPDNTMVTVAAARGILVESSDGPTWLYGTASEHNMLYQYNFYNTSSLFAGMIQTESPYFQYSTATESPGPFKKAVGVFNNDPDFSESCDGSKLRCNFSWAVMASLVEKATIAGAGLYSWFDSYDQSTCVDAQNCQQRLFNDQGDNGEFWVFNLVTIGSVEMISNTYSDEIIYAKNNTQANSHPFWSSLAMYGDNEGPSTAICDDDDLSPECITQDPCDLTRTFADMDALAAAKGSYDQSCAPYYAVDVLSDTLDKGLASYNDVNNGYDDVFDDYADYVKAMVGDVIKVFMADSTPQNETGGPGNKYFDCTFESGSLKKTQKCPWRWSQVKSYDYYTISYKLTDSKGFYNDLHSNFGINSTWVTFSDNDFTSGGCSGGGGGGGGGGHPGVDGTQPSSAPYQLERRCKITGMKQFGFPKGQPDFKVPNPKDVIVKAMPKLHDLQIQIAARQADLATGAWDGMLDDISQVISMPVFMVQQTIASMEDAKKKGKQYEAEKKREMVLEILGIVFAFLPFLDDLAPELLLADGLMDAAAFLGNTALAIKYIIDDPLSAPMSLLGILTDGAASKGGADYSKMAKARDSIKGDELAKMGKTIKALDDKYQSILKKPCIK